MIISSGQAFSLAQPDLRDKPINRGLACPLLPGHPRARLPRPPAQYRYFLPPVQASVTMSRYACQVAWPSSGITITKPSSQVTKPKSTSATIVTTHSTSAGRSRAATRRLVRMAVSASTCRSMIIGTVTTETANTAAASTTKAMAYTMAWEVLNNGSTSAQTELSRVGAILPVVNWRMRAVRPKQTTPKATSTAAKDNNAPRFLPRLCRDSWKLASSP